MSAKKDGLIEQCLNNVNLIKDNMECIAKTAIYAERLKNIKTMFCNRTEELLECLEYNSFFDKLIEIYCF